MTAVYNQRSWQRRQTYSGQQGSFKINKPPLPRAIWKPAVPSWEKDFCKKFGSLDWHTFLERKRWVHLDEKIINWDDSASEEAFHNAKKQFFARSHGDSCDISVNDPDLYNDDVDWDAEDDHLELLAELDSRHLVSDGKLANHEPVLIFGDNFFQEQRLCVGWEIVAESRDSWPVVEATGWGDEFDDDNVDGGDAGRENSWNQPAGNMAVCC